MGATVRRFSDADVIAAFDDALRDAGCRPDGPPIMDGQRRRVRVEGDKKQQKSGSYVGHFDGGWPAGHIRNFRDESRSGNWKYGGDGPRLTPEERSALNRKRALEEQSRARKRTACLERIAQKSVERWEAAAPAPKDHLYLIRKGIGPEGLRIDGDLLLVPMRDAEGRLRCIQTIAPDGCKLFPLGAQVHGLHLLLGDIQPQPGGVLLVGEGYATDRTLLDAEVPGAAVACTFSKTNFAAVARAYQERVPGLRVGFCGDNDHHHPRRPKPLPNVGKEAAEAAARDTGGVAILPRFEAHEDGSDWNDFAALHGLDAVRAAVEAGLPPPPPPLPGTVSLEKASDLIRDNSQGWLQGEFARVETRIQRAVWKASWERQAVPPSEFMPRPEPTRIEAMPSGSVSIELVQSSMSGGKTRWIASCSVEALARNPTVLGLRRRIAIVCANHLLAKEMVEACRAAAEPHGQTVTWYLGYEAKNPDNPNERMCPAHALRRQANAAGLDSGRACKAGKTKKGDGAKGEAAYCARHPDNPDRTLPPCAYLSNDLDGDIVVFAGWGTLHRALKDAFRRHVTLKKPPAEDGKDGGAEKVEVAPFDAIIFDEMDLGQLLSKAPSTTDGDEDGDGGADRGGLALDRIRTAHWPSMLATDFQTWEVDASEQDKIDMASCRRLLRAAREALAGGSISPRAMAAVAKAGEWRSASRWAWKAKSSDTSAVRPNMSPDTLREKTATLREHNRIVQGLALLLRLVAEMVEHCPDDEETELVHVRDGHVHMRHAHALASWMADLSPLLCDAKNHLDLLATWWKDRRLRAAINIEHARGGVRHIVAHDRMVGFSSLTPGKGKEKDPERVARAARKAAAAGDRADVLKWLFAGKAMIGGPKAMNATAQGQHKQRQALHEANAEAVPFIHFGAGRGLNVAEDARVAFISGRPLPPSRDVEIDRALLNHGRPVPADQRGYIKVASYHRMADGSVRPAERYGHMDPIADALVRLHSVDELEQLDQRTRPRRRTEARPLLQLSLSCLPLEDGRRVDELVSARDMERIHPEAVAAALGVVVKRESRGCTQVLARVLGDEPAQIKERLRLYPSGGLWEAVEEARNAPPERARDLAVAGTPEALARTTQIGDGWLEPARRRVMAQTVAGLWHAARLRLPGEDHWTAVAVRGANRAEAFARLTALLGESFGIEWHEAAAAEPDQGDEGAVVEEMLRAGVVVRDPDHALAVYPGLFENRSAAARGLKLVLEKIGRGAGISFRFPARRRFPYRKLYKETPLEPQVWNYFRFRLGAAKRGRFASAWVAKGREEEVRIRLEAAFGELSAWRSEEPPQDAPPQKERPRNIEAEPAPDVAALVEALGAEGPIVWRDVEEREPPTASEGAVDAGLPFAVVEAPPPRLLRRLAERSGARTPLPALVLALPPDPEEDAAEWAARALACKRHAAAFLRLAVCGPPGSLTGA